MSRTINSAANYKARARSSWPQARHFGYGSLALVVSVESTSPRKTYVTVSRFTCSLDLVAAREALVAPPVGTKRTVQVFDLESGKLFDVEAEVREYWAAMENRQSTAA